ncbi:MAG: CRISPR-associated protein Cas4 [Candidatus Altiarchaeota archaeon]
MIRASDLSRFTYCARLIYLYSVLGLEEEKTPERIRGVVGHAVRRELSMRQARLLGGIRSEEDVYHILCMELDSAFSDLPCIFAQEWSALHSILIPEVKAEVLAELDTLQKDLEAMVEDVGFERALKIVTPWRIEYNLKSDSLGLSGRVDKIMYNSGLVPVDIKTGVASELGWESDRIQLCAYGMLMEDKFSGNIPYGLLEYTRIAKRRPVLFTEELRRQVFDARDGVQEILEGAAPDVCPHGQPRKCESCNLRDECYRN